MLHTKLLGQLYYECKYSVNKTDRPEKHVHAYQQCEARQHHICHLRYFLRLGDLGYWGS